LALNGEPQHQRAFHIGDLGEKAVAEALEQNTAGTPTVILKNRRLPNRRGDIDFLAIAPSGVFVIDAKAVKGKVRVEKRWFASPRLRVSGRDRTKFIDGLDRQVAAVQEVLGGERPEAVSVQGVLCFTEADLPLLGKATMRGHLLLYRKSLVARVNAPGPLSAAAIERIARRLALALPPA
jgi:nuclease-like protein